MSSNHQKEALALYTTADFRDFWPTDVRLAVARAANTDGDLPPYAVRIVERALRDARGVERRMAKDIAIGEASLSQAQRKALAK